MFVAWSDHHSAESVACQPSQCHVSPSHVAPGSHVTAEADDVSSEGDVADDVAKDDVSGSHEEAGDVAAAGSHEAGLRPIASAGGSEGEGSEDQLKAAQDGKRWVNQEGRRESSGALQLPGGRIASLTAVGSMLESSASLNASVTAEAGSPSSGRTVSRLAWSPAKGARR